MPPPDPGRDQTTTGGTDATKPRRQRMTSLHNPIGAATGFSVLGAISLSGAPQWVAVVLALSAIFGLAALRTTAIVWRGERDAEKAKAERVEAECKDLKSERDALKIERDALAARPDIDRLWVLMEHHDNRTAELGQALTKTLAEVADGLRANTEAVRLWATDQARKI